MQDVLLACLHANNFRLASIFICYSSTIDFNDGPCPSYIYQTTINRVWWSVQLFMRWTTTTNNNNKSSSYYLPASPPKNALPRHYHLLPTLLVRDSVLLSPRHKVRRFHVDILCDLIGMSRSHPFSLYSLKTQRVL